jgi:uncharacterized protein (TIGR02147 family)
MQHKLGFHHQLLKNSYLARAGRNPSYSLRAFARDLQLSPSHLSRILNCKKKLSLRRAIEIANLLDFSPETKREFLGSVTDFLLKKTQRVPTGLAPDNLELFKIEVEQFKFLREWYHAAILEVISLEDFIPKYSWVAKQLGITPRQVLGAVSRLERLGLLIITPTEWKRTRRHFVISPQIASGAIRAYHTQMIEKGLIHLKTQPDESFEVRDVTGTTMAIDPKDFLEITRRIKNFRHSLMKFVDRKSAKQYTN